MTQQPSNTARIVLWIVIGVVLLILLTCGGGMFCLVSSKAFKEITSQVSDLAKSEIPVREFQSAAKAYVELHKDWPAKLEDFNLSTESLSVLKEKFDYHRPKPSDPDDFAVLTTKSEGKQSELFNSKIEVDKDFTSWVITKQPLEKHRSFNLSDE